MKRTICISMTLALALLLLLCCAPALADEPETYELWLGSVQVTSENKDDILGDGKASYVPETRTLTLNDNPVIPGLYSKYSYINSITAKIYSGRSITILGSYHMNSADECQYGILSYDYVTLSGNFKFVGTKAGISVGGLKVKEDSVSVEMQGGQNAALLHMGLYILEEPQGVSQPLGAVTQKIDDNWVFVDENGAAVTTVIIRPGYAVSLWLGSVPVWQENYQDILGDGKASFDPDTGTLTLNGDPVIPGKHTDENGISAKIYADWEITVQGSYHMNSADGCQYGVYTGFPLTLNGDFRFEGTEVGVRTVELTVKENSTAVEMQGGQTGLVVCWQKYVLEGTQGISQPLGASFEKVGGSWVYIDESGAPAKTVRIQPGYESYPLWLGSVNVRPENCQDIFGDGKASFDADTGTLTLRSGVNIPGTHALPDSQSAKIYASGISLSITGNYRMNAAEADYGVLVRKGSLRLSGDLTFRGTEDGALVGCDASQVYSPYEAVIDGSVTLTGGQNGLNVVGVAELKSGSVTLTGGNCGLFVTRKLTISGGNITISGDQKGAWVNFDGFEMLGGQASFTGRDDDGLRTNYDCTFVVRGGELTATSINGIVGIYAVSDIHIEGGSVTAVCQKEDDNQYIDSIGMICSSLYISGAAERVVLEGVELGVQTNALVISNQDAQNLQIVEPAGGFFYSELRTVMQPTGPNTGRRAKKVVIDHDYLLYLGNTRVNRLNQSDIFGDGKASFDPDTNILTLNEPTISGSRRSAADGSTVKIYASNIPLTIQGKYDMHDTDITVGLYAAGQPVTLNGNFTLKGTSAGIIAQEGLTVSGGIVYAQGTDMGGVIVLNGNLTLAGGTFTAISNERGVHVHNGQLILQSDINTAYFKGENFAAIVAMGGISLPESGTSQVKLVHPGGGYVGSHTVFDPNYVPPEVGPVYIPISSAGHYPARTVQFDSERLYGLAVGSTLVTPSNAADILGDGKASYDPVTKTLTLNEPVISGCTYESSSGFSASNTILANGVDRLTIKGKWHMSAPVNDFAIRVSDGALVLDGSFDVRGNIGGIYTYEETFVQSGSVYAYGGEIGIASLQLVIENGCGYVEMESGSNQPGVFADYPIYPGGYQFTDTNISFQPGQTIHTTHFQMDDVFLIMEYDRTVYKFMPTPKAKFTDVTGFLGAGSEDDPYQISSSGDWALLAQKVESGANLSGKHFGLMNDLTVTSMIGSSAHPFSGIFDGRGHTLTFNATAGGNYCAPFRYVGTAVIKNLRAAGRITTASKFAAGIVGDAAGSCRIVNCVSDTDIISTVSGDGTHGGFVAVGTNVTIIGSLFTGSITGANTTLCAGFLGWDRGGSSVSSCVYDGTMGTKSDTATFIRNVEEAANCYYFQAIGQGRDVGKAARLVYPSSYSYPLDFGGGVTYNVSGITAYPAGIRMEDHFYAGEGDRVSIRIVNAAPPAYTRIIGYYALPGELTEGEDDIWILTMPDAKTTILPTLVPESGMGTEEDPWLINALVFPFDDLPAGWYKALSGRFTTIPVTVSGETHLILAEGRSLSAPGGFVIGPDGSLDISGTGTLTVTGANGGPAISGDGPVTFADGLKVTAAGAQTPANAADRASACAASSVTISACDHEGGAVIAQAGASFCAYCNAALSFPDVGRGTAEDPFRIDTAETWNLFAHSVENGFNTQGKHFILMRHITVTAMMGTEANPFAGIFDGRGKTLTFTAANPDNDTRVAPFAYVGGATIRNLRTAGSVPGNYDRVSGLIGENQVGTVTYVTNCRVSMSLSGKSFVSAFCIGDGGGLTLQGCVFDGTLSTGNRSGGFVGWTEGNLTIQDCLFIPSSASGSTSCYSFYYNSYSTDTAFLTNTYRRTAYGAPQGEQAFSVTGGRGVTLDFGAQGTAYSVSGITAYPAGLLFDGVFYAGAGETVSLNMSADPWEGHDASFTADAGTLTETGAGWNLTLTDSDTVIAALRTPTFATSPAMDLLFSNATTGTFSNETGDKLFDDRNDTKWCSVFRGLNWVEFNSFVPIRVTAYSMTTGNDTASIPGRNPISWRLLGKLRAEDSWTVLTEETNNDHLPPENGAQVFFPLHTENACQRFRLEITAVQEGTVMQLAEFGMVGSPAFGVASFTFPAALTTIEERAFEDMWNMTTVDAHNVTSIGRRAFYGCFRLSAIRLPKDCDIHDEAFKGCNTVYVFAPAGGSTEAYCAAHENCVFVEE